MFNLLLGSGLGIGATLLVVLYLLLKYPNSVEKYVSSIIWLISFIWKRADYIAIKQEVQGKINSFVDNLHVNTTATNFTKVKIEWANEKENERIDFEDYETIIVMRDRKSRNKNFIHAAYFYTSEVLLSRSKKYLSQNQKKSLDLFATKRLLDTQSKASVEEFMNNYFIPSIENEDVKDYIRQYQNIEEVGLFFPVLIQELTYLGNKAILSNENKKEDVIKEVKSLITFLKDFSEREVGDNVQDTFNGNLTRCSIKIVASRQSRENNNVVPQKERVCRAVNDGCENIYIIGSAQRENKKFMDSVVEEVLREKNNLKKEKELEFKGRITIRGENIPTKTYFVHLHNPDNVSHIIK